MKCDKPFVRDMMLGLYAKVLNFKVAHVPSGEFSECTDAGRSTACKSMKKGDARKIITGCVELAAAELKKSPAKAARKVVNPFSKEMAN